MFKLSKFSRMLLILSFVFLSNPILYSEWSDTINYGIGNLALGSGGYFLQIPDSNYVFYFSENDILTFDTTNMRSKGGKLTESRFNQSSTVIIPDPTSGWNLFGLIEVTRELCKFRKLHIFPDGQLGEDILLPKTVTKASPSVGVPEKSQIWFFTDKILQLNTIDDTWVEIEFPEGWDSDNEYIYAYPALAYNSIIGVSYGKTIADYQAFILDIVTFDVKVITAEKNFFKSIKDINAWNGHPGQFIIMKKSEIWSYDRNTGDIELLMKDLGVSAGRIYQNETGTNLFVLGNKRNLYILDLVEETAETHELPLHEGFTFMSSAYDSKRKKIIAFTQENGPLGTSEIVIIDLDDLSIKYPENIPKNIGLTYFFLEDLNKLIFTKGFCFYIADLGSNDIRNSIPMLYSVSSWNIIDDFEKPILLNYSNSIEFMRIFPDFRRETYKPDIPSGDVYQFPNSKTGIIRYAERIYITGTQFYFVYHFYEYDFEEKSSREITLPYNSDLLFTDAENNQIVGIGEKISAINNNYVKNPVVQFINQDLSVSSWLSSIDLYLYSDLGYIFDDNNGYLWLIYKNWEKEDLYFNELSVRSKSLVNEIILSKNLFTHMMNIVFDPNDKYIYFIDEINDETQRELGILDTQKGEIIKRILLQINVENLYIENRVIPGI
ncbi:hypothetical protein KKB18_04950, partial [bacterium]|nr:hypothetical protein [bacterium]